MSDLPDPIGDALDDTFFSWHLADLTVAMQVAIAKEDGYQELTERKLPDADPSGYSAGFR